MKFLAALAIAAVTTTAAFAQSTTDTMVHRKVLLALHTKIVAADPTVVGEMIPDWSDKTKWRIDHEGKATPAQTKALAAAIAAFDPKAEAAK